MTTATAQPTDWQISQTTLNSLLGKWRDNNSLAPEDIASIEKLTYSDVRSLFTYMEKTITAGNYHNAAHVVDTVLRGNIVDRKSNAVGSMAACLNPKPGCDTTIAINLLRDGILQYGTPSVLAHYLLTHAPHASFDNNRHAIEVFTALIPAMQKEVDATEESDIRTVANLGSFKYALKILVDNQLQAATIAKDVQAGETRGLKELFGTVADPGSPLHALTSEQQHERAKAAPVLLEAVSAYCVLGQNSPA